MTVENYVVSGEARLISELEKFRSDGLRNAKIEIFTNFLIESGLNVRLTNYKDREGVETERVIIQLGQKTRELRFIRINDVMTQTAQGWF